MTVVQGTALDSGKTPIPYAQIRVTLVTGTPTMPGYSADGELIGPHTETADEIGAWSIDLTPNSQITPAQTYYKLTEANGTSMIDVPDGGGPYAVADILVTSPPAPAAMGITGVQVAANGSVAGNRREINFIAGPNTSVSAVDDPDTNSVDVTVSSTGGAPASTVQSGTSYGAAPAVGVDTTYAREDHQHGTPALTSLAPTGSGPGDNATVGTASAPARADHLHGREAFGAVAGPPAFGDAKSNGTASSVPRSDHVHGMPPLPAASTNAAGIAQFDNTASDLQPAGVAALGSTGKATDAGHVHPLQPWQFSVAKYGAVGDLNVVVDAVTNGTAVVTSASGKFTAAMVGKPVAGKGFLTSGVTTLVTTVASYQSPTQVTLAAAATSTATGLQMAWGTDDTGAFQAAQDAAMTYGNSSPFSKVVQVVIPPAPGGFGYMIAGALKNSDTAGNAVYNSQITTGLRSDRLAGLTVEWLGPADAGSPRHWNADYPAFTGATLFSTGVFPSQAAQATTDPHSISNGGNPSCLGGPTGKFGYGTTGTNPQFNNLTMALTNVSIMNVLSASGWSICPFNFYGTARAHLRRCSFGTSGVVQYYTGTGGSGGNTDFSTLSSFSGGASVGGLMPAAGNNASNLIEDCVWNGGYTYGPVVTEHTVCTGVNTVLYCWGGLGVAGSYGDGGSGAGSLHAIELGQWCVEACTYHLVVWGAGAAGIGPFIRGSIDTEGSVQIRGNTNVAANLQALCGELHLVGSPSTPVFTFPTGLRLIKETQARGPVASPTYTLGTPQINTFYRDATVTISGGTVTAVKVSALAGGASGAPTMTTLAGFTSGTFRVPAGCWWEIDGTVQPTSMQWILD
jgi:hypothetical protein